MLLHIKVMIYRLDMSRALMALFCLCLVTYFVSSSAEFNYRLVLILLEMFSSNECISVAPCLYHQS
jgi:hypothetical protein